MKLVYKDRPAVEVKIGDVVFLDGEMRRKVEYFRTPHKPSSEGKVTLDNGAEYYVSVIGAEWIEREDRIQG